MDSPGPADSAPTRRVPTKPVGGLLPLDWARLSFGRGRTRKRTGKTVVRRGSLARLRMARPLIAPPAGTEIDGSISSGSATVRRFTVRCRRHAVPGPMHGRLFLATIAACWDSNRRIDLIDEVGQSIGGPDRIVGNQSPTISSASALCSESTASLGQLLQGGSAA